MKNIYKIKKLIKSKNKKCIRVAAEISLSKQAFSSRCKNFDKGVFSFSRKEVEKICEYLEIKPIIFFNLFLY